LASGELVVIVSWGTIVRVNTADAVACLLSVTWIVKVEVPAVVGVPLITPVVAFNVRTGGKVPVVTDQV